MKKTNKKKYIELKEKNIILFPKDSEKYNFLHDGIWEGIKYGISRLLNNDYYLNISKRDDRPLFYKTSVSYLDIYLITFLIDYIRYYKKTPADIKKNLFIDISKRALHEIKNNYKNTLIRVDNEFIKNNIKYLVKDIPLKLFDRKKVYYLISLDICDFCIVINKIDNPFRIEMMDKICDSFYNYLNYSDRIKYKDNVYDEDTTTFYIKTVKRIPSSKYDEISSSYEKNKHTKDAFSLNIIWKKVKKIFRNILILYDCSEKGRLLLLRNHINTVINMSIVDTMRCIYIFISLGRSINDFKNNLYINISEDAYNKLKKMKNFNFDNNNSHESFQMYLSIINGIKFLIDDI
jgi:hypothetical protein